MTRHHGRCCELLAEEGCCFVMGVVYLMEVVLIVRRDLDEMLPAGYKRDETAEHRLVHGSSTEDRSYSLYAGPQTRACHSTRHSRQTYPSYVHCHRSSHLHHSYASESSSSASPQAARKVQEYKYPLPHQYHHCRQMRRSLRPSSPWLRTSSACASRRRKGRGRRRGEGRHRLRCRRWLLW
jgi:hypothetical protein